MKRILTFLIISLCSTSVYAQTVELSETQSAFNKEGANLSSEGKLKQALAKFEASAAIGDANVIQLNIGRTYAKMGECKRAKEAYAKVRTAPKVASPSPSEIESFLKKFESDLPEVCPARLELVCTPDGATATVNGNAMPCNAGIVDVEPGDYAIVGTANGETFETSVTLASGESQTVNVTVPVKEVAVEDPDSGVKKSSGGGLSPLKTTGLIVGGIGLATLAGAFIYDLAVIAPNKFCYDTEFPSAAEAEDEGCDVDDFRNTKLHSDLESMRTVGSVLFIGGGVLTAAGVALFVIPSKKETQVGFTYKAGKAGVRLRHRF